ncbi:MAG: gliding motility-associated C-terminal domain-containing protein [Chitinophagales bacterium]|nr:gliding motility-associated C-terminal domain-containing protein [Chitinophagales bacterium]
MHSIFTHRIVLAIWLLAALATTAIPIQAQGLRNMFFNSDDDIVRLDFSTDPPTPWNTGISGAPPAEGIAHYEDVDGNVVFWFNNNGVYDQTGTIMPGSIGIFANASAAEVCIAPKPDDPCKFYIFYNQETCTNLYYSIIDLELNGGLGNVTNLNTLMAAGQFSEGVEVIRIPNTCTYWVLAYKCNSGAGFNRFFVTPDGIENHGVIFPYNMPIGGYDGRGELDYHAGRIGMAYAWSNQVMSANFDPYTGIITNPITLDSGDFNGNGPFGIEFSPDGSKMYFTLWYTMPLALFQYNFATSALTQYNPPAGGTVNNGFGQIELGRDGKLYAIQDGGTRIVVVNNPNGIPTFNNINTGSTLGLGISDPIQSDILSEDIFTSDTLCRVAGAQVTLFPIDPNYTYEWASASDPTNILQQGSNFQFTMGLNDTAFIANAISTTSGCALTVAGCGRYKYFILNSPTIDAGPNTIIDPGESVTLQATSVGNGATYLWFPADDLDNAFLLQPTASPDVTTNYFASAQKGPCQSNDFMTVYVRTEEYDTLCVAIGQSYTLEMPAGQTNVSWVNMAIPGTVLSNNPSYTITAPSSITTFRGRGDNATNDGGVVRYITLVPTPALDAGPEQTIGNGGSATLNATGGGTAGYTWAANPTLSATNIANPIATPSVTSWYYVSSYSDAACPATDSVRVVVITTIEETDSLCAIPGQALTLSLPVDTFGSRRWYDVATPTASLGTGSSLSVTLQGNNYVTYAAECLTNAGDTVIFYTVLMPNPNLTATGSTVVEGQTGTLTVTGGSNYAWTPADQLNDPNSANPTTVPLFNDTEFTVTNTTDDGCQNTTSITVPVISESIILVPSGFSPNNDGINDVLFLVPFNIIELREFKIFNRWGQKMFETTTLSEGWDGQFQDSDQEIGTYVYLVRAVNKEGEEVEYKGNITLVR